MQATALDQLNELHRTYDGPIPAAARKVVAIEAARQLRRSPFKVALTDYRAALTVLGRERAIARRALARYRKRKQLLPYGLPAMRFTDEVNLEIAELDAREAVARWHVARQMVAIARLVLDAAERGHVLSWFDAREMVVAPAAVQSLAAE
jgi:hypothetical protein